MCKIGWTKEEIEFLKENRELSHAEAGFQLLRSEASVRNKRSELGLLSLKRRAWTYEERCILRQYYHAEGEKIMSRLPGRSWQAIKSQVLYLRKRKWKI